jgi:hypothetical protein
MKRSVSRYLGKPHFTHSQIKATPRDILIMLMFVFVILLVSASSSWCDLGIKKNNDTQKAQPKSDKNGDNVSFDSSNKDDAFILKENQDAKFRPPERSDISSTFKDKVKKVIEKQNGGDGEQGLSTAFRKVKKIVSEKQEGGLPMVAKNRVASVFISPYQYRREKLESEGDGSVFEGWEGGHKVKDGLAEQTWQQNKDWEDKKKQVKGAMMQICAMFNDLLMTKIFPGGLNRRFIENGDQFRVVDSISGRCVSLKKWISFVDASIATQMGYTKGSKTLLAKYVPLAFDSLDAAIKELPPLLTDDESCPVYKKGSDGLEDEEGVVLSYTIIWPVDGSVLLEYKLRT